MKLFHGSKTYFSEFSTDYLGTGETGDIHAIWFADNFNAARNHCYKIRSLTHRSVWVYECELLSDTAVLNTNLPFAQQPDIQKKLDDTLPVCISVQSHYDVLFCDYHRYSKGIINGVKITADHKINLLRAAGIDAISDYERGMQDSHLHGDTTVVLTPEKIRILRIHEV